MTLRVLVTGATGFTGSRVVAACLARGHDVVAFVRATSRPDAVAALKVPTAVGDLGDPASLERALRGRDALVNVASLGFGHADGIVAAARGAGIRRSLFLGTTAVRTRLDSPTKAVRLAAERAVLGEPAIGATLLRPTMIYGAPGDRNLERLVRAVARLPVVPVPGDGTGLFQPVHVEDVAAAVAAVLPRDDLAGMAFDVPGPTPLSLDEVVRAVAAALHRRVAIVHVPLPASRAAARLATAWLGRSVVRDEQLLRLLEDKSADPGPAAAAFGYAPRPFEEGIRQEVAALGRVRESHP